MKAPTKIPKKARPGDCQRRFNKHKVEQLYTFGSQTESVYLNEDNDERLEPNVQKSVDQCDVKVEEEDL